MRRRLASVLLLLLGSSLARADSDGAKGAFEKGKASLARREWPAAAAHFQRALSEDASFNEARLGLAEAFFGAGDRAHAIVSLRETLEALERVLPLSADDATLYGRARKRLGEASTDDAALDSLLQRHAADLTALAVRWTERDETVAQRAARAALTLVPDHTKATALAQRIRQDASGKRAAAFSGRDLLGWKWVTTPEWTVSEGLLVGDVHGRGLVLQTNETWSGDFDVVVEARLVEAYEKEGAPRFAVIAPFLERERYVNLGYLRSRLHWFRRTGPGEPEEIFDRPYADVLGGLDPAAWNTYEVRLRGDEIVAVVNGEEIGRVPRTEGSGESHIGLAVQFCKAQFRRVDVVRR